MCLNTSWPTVFAPPRAPPSFPTRRSSDLNAVPPPPGSPTGTPGTYPCPGKLTNPGAKYPRVDVSDDFSKQYSRDRKSTRLNSSHRCISYAVFCLKKKIPGKGNNETRGTET